MSGAIVGMALECKHCAHRFPDDNTPVEALLLHFQVEHDTDHCEVELRPVCQCGAAMQYLRTERLSMTRERDEFQCGACGERGAIRRRV